MPQAAGVAEPLMRWRGGAGLRRWEGRSSTRCRWPTHRWPRGLRRRAGSGGACPSTPSCAESTAVSSRLCCSCLQTRLQTPDSMRQSQIAPASAGEETWAPSHRRSRALRGPRARTASSVAEALLSCRRRRPHFSRTARVTPPTLMCQRRLSSAMPAKPFRARKRAQQPVQQQALRPTRRPP